MPETLADPILDALVGDFGGNYAFALDLLEDYRKDRRSVDGTWREYFDRITGAQPKADPEPAAAAPAAATQGGSPAVESAPSTAAAPAASGSPVADVVARPVQLVQLAPASRSKALVVPAILPGDIAQPIRGGAMRIVENMEASLTVPTATSVRTLPVRTLEENRTILNKHRIAQGAGKISFTHLVAWAILRALDTFPRLNDAYAELEGQPHRIQRDAVRLGVAVDVQKKDGTPHAAGAQHQGRGHARLRGVPEGVRRPDRALAQGRDLARRLHGHDGLAHQPRHRGHHRVRAAPDARPGADRRHREPRLSGRVPLDGAAHALAAGHQQGHDHDLDVRPPHHPGRGVGPVPLADRGAAEGRGPASTSASSAT